MPPLEPAVVRALVGSALGEQYGEANGVTVEADDGKGLGLGGQEPELLHVHGPDRGLVRGVDREDLVRVGGGELLDGELGFVHGRGAKWPASSTGYERGRDRRGYRASRPASLVPTTLAQIESPVPSTREGSAERRIRSCVVAGRWAAAALRTRVRGAP